jgi:PhoH-like ATPase
MLTRVLDSVLDPTGAALSSVTAKPIRKPRAPKQGAAAARIKNYVLDTNVLLHDPDALLNFQDNSVLLPIEVLEEIDKFKRETSERGQNARTVSRLLDQLRTRGSLSDGVPLESGGKLRIIFGPQFGLHGSGSQTNGNAHGQGDAVPSGSVDNRILALALAVRKQEPKTPTILVTKDINLRLKADVYGLPAQDYETDRVNLKDLYTGMFELAVSSAKLTDFRANGELSLPTSGFKRAPSEYCTLTSDAEPKRTLLARVDASGKKLVPLHDCQNVWGIKPRNREQHFALDALLDEKIKLVTLMGKAGTGKTLLALAAGLKRSVSDREFRRLVVARPTVSMGKELGFLPGSLEEKLGPWMQPIHDALEMLGDLNMGRDGQRSSDLLRNGTLVVEALSYIRGRSIANQFVIVDEAQNLTPLEAKTILTRVGTGSKIVLTGDPYQIDNPYVDSASNGFIYVINRFRDQAIAAHIELSRGERSDLAEIAANIL